MSTRKDPWYIHAALYVVIAILTLLLIKVAIIDPTDYVESEKANKTESRLRMDNIRQAEILWQKKYGRFTSNLDSLVLFIKHDPFVDSVVSAFDSLTMKSANPFKPLYTHKNLPDSLFWQDFTPDSLKWSPKTHTPYILQIDTSIAIDTVINRRGKITRIDSTVVYGNRYYLEDPDGYGTVGSVDNDALKNTASWE
ncbi:hypothetical protein LJE86_09180 [bacterium BMS3Abin03]|jgi:hypothetical protein|nr:hypothetical protein [bacterium BMS3Abin03]MCG6961155.1 hypothetical protein [bacterium BMS3Abin03]